MGAGVILITVRRPGQPTVTLSVPDERLQDVLNAACKAFSDPTLTHPIPDALPEPMGRSWRFPT